MKRKSPWKVLLEGIIGIVIFLILLGIANLVSNRVESFYLEGIVEFLNLNLLFILLIFVVLLLGEFFASLMFPFNIVYPLFNAVGGAYVVEFIFRIVGLVDSLAGTTISDIFGPFYLVVVILVVVIVLIVGYIHVFSSLRPKRKRVKKSEVEWKDVGEEVKGAAYNLASGVKKKLEPKKKVKKKGKKKKGK